MLNDPPPTAAAAAQMSPSRRPSARTGLLDETSAMLGTERRVRAGRATVAAPGGAVGTPAEQSLAISRLMVQSLRDMTGRGPDRVHTTIAGDNVLVAIQDSLTPGERQLARHGDAGSVRAMRRAVQDASSGRLTAGVESITGRRVAAHLGDHAIEPDTAVAVFLLTDW